MGKATISHSGQPADKVKLITRTLLLAALAVVASAQSTQPLNLTTTAFNNGVVGIPYSLQLTGVGGTPPYKWSVLPAIVTLPVPGQVAAGLLLNSTTGLVSGTPTGAGTFGFTITLTDSANGSASKPYTLTITPGGPLSITTTTLSGAIVGAPYSQTLQAAAGVPPYKWSIAAGSLPGGLTLDSVAGMISGAPSAAGSFSFTVQATDSASTPAIVKQPLTLSVVAPPPLTLTTASLPAAIQGAPYSQQLSASGGVPPYHWSVSSGALPAGLSLNATTGLLSGTAPNSGTSSFSVQVTDSAVTTPAATAKPFTVTVAQLTSISVVPGALPAGTTTIPYSQTLPREWWSTALFLEGSRRYVASRHISEQRRHSFRRAFGRRFLRIHRSGK